MKHVLREKTNHSSYSCKLLLRKVKIIIDIIVDLSSMFKDMYSIFKDIGRERGMIE